MHIYSLGPKLMQQNFFLNLSYLYEVVRTNFSADFWTFRNFSPKFRENCAPPSDECENYVASLKVQSLPKKNDPNRVQIGL